MRGGQEKGRLKACQGEEEVRLEGMALLFFFLTLKVQMSGWQAARGVQPKNLFNVCFTGRQEG